MKKCKRMLALVSSVLMMATSFALPYGVAADEETTPAAAYPNADPSERYYVVGRFEDGKTESVKTENAGDATWPKETYPHRASGGDIFLPAQGGSIDLSGWDTGTLAVMLDVKIDRKDGVTGNGSLNHTGNQRFTVNNGNTTVLNVQGAPYLTYFTTDYANRAGDTITYVIPWEYVYSSNGKDTPLKQTEDTTVTRLFWSVFNDTWQKDLNGDGIFDDAVELNVALSNAKIVDLSRDGEGNRNGLVALYSGDTVTKTSTGSWGNNWQFFSLTTPLWGQATLDENASYTLLFDAKASAYKYFVAKPCDENGDVVTPDSSKTNYGISQYKTAFYENYDEIPTEDIPYLQSGVPGKFVNGSLKVNDVESNQKPVLTDNWTTYQYNLNTDFKSSITGNVSKLIFEHFNDNYISVDNKVVNFSNNDFTTISGVGGNSGRYGLPMTSSVRHVMIVDSNAVALQKAVKDAENYIYTADDKAVAFEQALADAKAALKDRDTTVDLGSALSALNTAKAALTDAEYHANGTVATISAMPEDWRNLDGVTGNDTGITLAGDLSKYVLQLKVESADGTTPLSSLFSGNLHLIELRNNVGAENVYGWNVNFSNIEGGDTTSCVVSIPLTPASQINGEIAPGITLNRANLSTAGESRFTRDTILSYITQARMPSHNDFKGSKAIASDVKIIDTLPQAIDAEIKAFADTSLPVGKYTAASTKAYLEAQEEAKAMLTNADATLQQKSQLVKKIDAAKAQLEGVVAEYIQFGAPDTIYSFTNTGDKTSNRHSFEQKYSVTSQKELPHNLDTLALRMEVRVDRDDGGLDATDTFVNREIELQGVTIAGETKNLQTYLREPGNNKLLYGQKTGEWHTLLFPISNFGVGNKDDKVDLDTLDLSTVTMVIPRGYNDTNQGITVQLRNMAIVDTTNSDLLVRLQTAFADVTTNGKEYTPDSLAAYKAVYDEWYPVYQYVDMDKAEQAIAAMAEAKKLLVCVDPEVMTFSNWNRTLKNGYNINGEEYSGFAETTFYNDWTGSDQGTVDINDHNWENLRLRFEYQVEKINDAAADLPDELTLGSFRLAVRKQAGNEQAYSVPQSVFGTTCKSNEINVVDIPFTALTTSDGDGILRDILCYININEFKGADKASYTVSFMNARLVDITKELLAEELEAAANETGIYAENEALTTYLAAQEAAKELLKGENPTYAQLVDAKKAIDDAKMQLNLVGHTLLTWSEWNSHIIDSKMFYANWTGADQGSVDLTKYDKDQLHIRFNYRFDKPEGLEAEKPNINWMRLAIKSSKNDADNQEQRVCWEGGTTLFNGIEWGEEGFVDLPLSEAPINTIDWTDVRDITLIVNYPNSDTVISTKDYFTVSNARIVDVTAEENLGSVKTEGNGYVEITGGLVKGATDTLTAKTTATDGTVFDHWVVNGEDKTENPITLDVTGNQDVTAVFQNASKSVTVTFIGKYNVPFATKTVRTAAELAQLLQEIDIPQLYGYAFTGWAESTADADLEQYLTGDSCTFTAQYETDKTTAAYTVSFDANTVKAMSGEQEIGTADKLTFDQRVTATALTATDENPVAYWVLDGAKVGFGKMEYTFYASGNNEIAVVLQSEAVEITPEVVLQQAALRNSGDNYTFTVIAQTSIPEGSSVSAYGVVYSNKYSVLCALKNGDTVPQDSANIVNVQSSKTGANEQYLTSLLNIASGKTRYARAYAIVDGQAVYSDTFVGVKSGENAEPKTYSVSDYQQ